MNKRDQKYKNKIIESYAKMMIFNNCNTYKNSQQYMRHYLDDEFLDREIMPSNRQLKEWRICSQAYDKIKYGQLDIDPELNLWTSSYCRGLEDSGALTKCTYKNIKCSKNIHSTYTQNEYKKNTRRGINDSIYILNKEKEYIMSHIKASKFSVKIIDMGKKYVLKKFYIMEYGKMSEEIIGNEYFGGLFTRNEIINNEYILIMPPSEDKYDRIEKWLKLYNIIYKKEEDGIKISPFYGALFFGYMDLDAGSRILNIKNAYMCPELPYLYWNIIRGKNEKAAPLRKMILPFSVSYATHWNRGLHMGYKEVRKRGIDIGILGVNKELLKLMKEWIYYQNENNKNI